MKCEENSKIS